MLLPSSLLTPQNCIAPSRVKAFLVASRSISDDSIRQHLNERNVKKDCNTYFKDTIVPQWKVRGDVINYCEQYAQEQRLSIVAVKEENQEFNLRLDPYALRNHQDEVQERFNQLDSIDQWVKNEQLVEVIIRDQTSDVLNDKCFYDDWVTKFRDTVNRK